MKTFEYIQIEPVGRKGAPPYESPGFMKFKVFQRILNDFPDLKELHLQGTGEPLAHPRFFEMVTWAAVRGVKVSTNTGLGSTLLNEQRAECFVESGLDSVHISVDAASKETYERIHTHSSFEHVLKNLELLCNARKKFSTWHPRMRLITVIMKQNLHELPAIVQLASRFSIPSIFVQHLASDFKENTFPEEYQPVRESGMDQTLVNENPARTEEFFNAARHAAGELNIDLSLPGTVPQRSEEGTPSRDRCEWPWRESYIPYQGYDFPAAAAA